MSKTIPIALQAHYDTGCTTTAFGLRLTRADGEVYGFTSAQVPAEILLDGDTVTYSEAQGLDISALVASAGLAVDGLELSTLDDGSLFTRADIFAGLWNNARYYLFRYNWASPSDGVEPLQAGALGDVRLERGMVVGELRALQWWLQQPTGAVSTKTCRARFADFPEPASDTMRCRLDPVDWTVTGAITHVTSAQVFRDEDRTEALEWFGEGLLTFTSGSNAGARQKVRTYATDGTFTLVLPMISAVQVGDTYSVISGCRKRLEEDCRDKHDNVLNFQGEPHRPMLDELTQAPEQNAS